MNRPEQNAALEFYQQNSKLPPNKMLVFVYGALMHKLEPEQKPVGAKIKDHRVSFKLKGISGLEPSFALLVPSPGDEAWGVLALFDKSGWKKASKHEVRYREVELEATIAPGLSKKCVVLLEKVRPSNRKEINPSARYSNMLYKAAVKYGFPEEVANQYKQFKDQGDKRTLFMPWVMPCHKKIRPYFSMHMAYTISLSLPLLVVLFLMFALQFVR